MRRPVRIAVVNGVGVGFVYAVDQVPRLGETLIASSCVISPGGKGTNQAIGVARLGGQTSIISAVGDDVLASIPRDALRRQGVDLTGLLVRPGQTLIGSVIVDVRGENVVVVALGVLAAFSAADVEQSTVLINTADVCLVGLEIPSEPAIAALRIARAAGVTTILNPAPAPDPAVARELLASADIVVPNEGEGEALSGEQEPWAIAQWLIAHGPSTAIVTTGGRGAVLADRDGVRPIAPHPIEGVVDTSGAGDAFNAAFSMAIALGHTAEVAARYGNEAGARICRGTGFATALDQWTGFTIPETDTA